MKVVAFDFAGLATAFDAARAAGQQFSVANNLAAYRLWGSDTAAIGGAISYQYAKTGSLGTLTHDQMRAVLNAPGFGTSAQPIAPGTSAMAAVVRSDFNSAARSASADSAGNRASEQLSPALAFDRPVSEPSSREPDLRVTLERMSANSGAKPYPLERAISMPRLTRVDGAGSPASSRAILTTGLPALQSTGARAFLLESLAVRFLSSPQWGLSIRVATTFARSKD
jgi:hypothetical protein